MLEFLAANPIVLTIAGVSPYDYVWEVSLFLLYLQIFEDLGNDQRQGISFRLMDIPRVAIRAFGGNYFLLPMVLGQLPSTVLVNADKYMGIYVIALVFYLKLQSFVPKRLWEPVFLPLMKLAYAIYFANVCVTATMAGFV